LVRNREVYDYAIKLAEERLGLSIYAALAYGSRIAGYASKHSDYDVIIIAENFGEEIKYIYEKIGGNYVSILTVDKAFFEEDIYEAEHGEFVAGRLYTVYHPLINGDYIRKMEIHLKKRTVVEEICGLFDAFDKITYDLVIPVKFFLLSRLRRRMQAYPPVKYSYYKMFYGSNGVRNMEFSLKGFYEALRILAEEGLVEFVSTDSIRVLKEPEICRTGLPGFLRFFKRGVKSYLTHGKSAKVKPAVVLEETISKIRRSIEGMRIPKELSHPETLLGLREGFLSVEYTPLNEVVKSIFGTKASVDKIIRKGVFSELYIIYVSVGGDKYVIIRKSFSPLYTLKWIFIQLWLIDLKRFIITGKRRFINEYIMMRKLYSELGVKCPRPLLLSWPDNALYMEYIHGKRLVDLDPVEEREAIIRLYREWGELIGWIHSRGLYIGDTKPHNVIVKDGEWYIVDLEQAGVGGDRAWDIVEALYYTYLWGSRLSGVGVEELCRSFLEGYLKYGDVDAVAKASSWRYARPFLPLVPLYRIFRIRRMLRKYSSS